MPGLRLQQVRALLGLQVYRMWVRAGGKTIYFDVDVTADTGERLATEFSQSFPGVQHVFLFFKKHTPKRVGRFVVYPIPRAI